MSSEENQFHDARDWEKELQDLREKVTAEKQVAREERKKNKWWEGEAGDFQRKWERERMEKAAMMKSVRVLKDELHRLRCELEQAVGMKNGQERRAAGMQREIVTLRSDLEGVRKELGMERENTHWYKGKVIDLERQNKEWEAKENERRMKEEQERMEKERKEQMKREITKELRWNKM